MDADNRQYQAESRPEKKRYVTNLQADDDGRLKQDGELRHIKEETKYSETDNFLITADKIKQERENNYYEATSSDEKLPDYLVNKKMRTGLIPPALTTESTGFCVFSGNPIMQHPSSKMNMSQLKMVYDCEKEETGTVSYKMTDHLNNVDQQIVTMKDGDTLLHDGHIKTDMLSKLKKVNRKLNVTNSEIRTKDMNKTTKDGKLTVQNVDYLNQESTSKGKTTSKGRKDGSLKASGSDVVSHEGEQVKLIKCNVCSAEFAEVSEYLKHKRTHLDENADCVGLLGTNIVWGQQKERTREKPYKCEYCGTGFVQNRDLKSHIMKHTGETPYKCELCGEGFSQSRNLRTHRMKHTGEKPYKCDLCGEGFSRGDTLKTHRRKHTGEKPYKCDVCGAGFSRSGHLKIHIMKHTGEKPFKCDFCDAGFSRSCSLRTHRRKHTGEKPYKCDVCDMSFFQSGHLKVHKLKHTGEKPCKCDICGIGFSHSSHVKRHKKYIYGNSRTNATFVV